MRDRRCVMTVVGAVVVAAGAVVAVVMPWIARTPPVCGWTCFGRIPSVPLELAYGGTGVVHVAPVAFVALILVAGCAVLVTRAVIRCLVPGLGVLVVLGGSSVVAAGWALAVMVGRLAAGTVLRRDGRSLEVHFGTGEPLAAGVGVLGVLLVAWLARARGTGLDAVAVEVQRRRRDRSYMGRLTRLRDHERALFDRLDGR